MSFVPFASVVAAFQSSLAQAAEAAACFAIADLKVDLPAEVMLSNGQVLVELASSASKVDPAVLTRLSFTLGATCAPDAMPQPSLPSPWAVVPSGTTDSLYGIASADPEIWVVGKD